VLLAVLRHGCEHQPQTRSSNLWTLSNMPDGGLRHAGYVLAVNRERAALDVIEAEEQPQQRRLAAAS